MSSPEPRPLAAHRAWEHHADAPLVAIAWRGRSVHALDAAGVAVELDASGRVVARVALGLAPLAAARLPSGGWLVLEGDAVHRASDTGEIAWSIRYLSAQSACAGLGGLVLGTEHRDLIVLAPDGHETHRLKLQHGAAFVAACSSEGDVLVAETSGHLSLAGRDGIRWAHALGHPVHDLSGSPTGLFALACGELGAQLGTPAGTLTGIVSPGPAVRRVALAPDGSHLLCADAEGSLSHVNVATGWSAWHGRRTQSVGTLALSPRGRAALAVLGGCSVERLDFEDEAPEGRGARLELDAEAPRSATWREPDAVIEGVPESGQFVLAPSGEVLAITDPAWNEALLHDRAGRAVGKVRDVDPGTRIAFTWDGAQVIVHGQERLAFVARATGEKRDVRGAFRHVLAGHDGLVATGLRPSRLARLRDGAVVDTAPLPAEPLALAASEDLATVAVALADGTLAAWGRGGKTAWRRWHPWRDGSLVVAGTLTWLLEEGSRATAIADDGTVVAEVELPEATSLLALEGRAHALLAGPRWATLAPDGTVSASPPLRGATRLARTEEGLRQVEIEGRVVGCRDEGGALLWRCEAQELVSASDPATAGGMLAVRAGRKLLLFGLGRRARPAAARAAFLET